MGVVTKTRFVFNISRFFTKSLRGALCATVFVGALNSQAATPQTELISDWPQASQDAALTLLQKYGPADEATPSHMTWKRRGPFKRITVHAEAVLHRFPRDHYDVVEHVVDARVKPESLSSIAQFHGSVSAQRTPGELSARCHSEESNTLALNVAHEIAEGKRSSEEGRRFYVRALKSLSDELSTPHPYTQSLRFSPAPDAAADPDENVRP